MTLKLMGKKRGMMQLFDAKGTAVVGTVIEVEPNVVTQIKTKETDGYNAIQVGFEIVQGNDPRTVVRRAKKPQWGLFQKIGVAPRRHFGESRLDKTEDYQIGQEITVDAFKEISHVDVTATSKGKGYQGTIKRHHFAGGPASHGSGFHRHGGSTGMRTSPGRCLPGGGFPGHMGHETVTVQNLRVALIDTENNVIVVEGAVPGPVGGLVTFFAAVKKAKKKAK
jgi:large subunit ribosomal protein L3